MTGKRKFYLSVLAAVMIFIITVAALVVYGLSKTAPDPNVLVWSVMGLGAVTGAFSFGNAVEHWSQRSSRPIGVSGSSSRPVATLGSSTEKQVDKPRPDD